MKKKQGCEESHAEYSFRARIFTASARTCNPSASYFCPVTALYVMRVDLPASVSSSSARSYNINEFAIVFLTMMFLWILVAAGAMIYGRFWCGYLCPQMIFSEAADGLEKRINRMSTANSQTSAPGARRALSVPVFRILLPGSIFSPLSSSLILFAGRPLPSPADHRHAHRRRHYGASVTLVRSSTSPSCARVSAPRSARTDTCKHAG